MSRRRPAIVQRSNNSNRVLGAEESSCARADSLEMRLVKTAMKKSMSLKTVAALVFAVACVASMRLAAGAQSLTYTKGQNVAPAYEGWEQDADGSKFFVFGYMNRNWVEELDLPPGPD